MDEPLLSVASLHALVYCERLFYLEEVEHIRVANAAVYAGRTHHIEKQESDPEGTLSELEVESAALGLRGRVDVLRRRDGRLIPVERKRGRAGGQKGAPAAWRTDQVQLAAYALLVEEAYGAEIDEGRVHYAASGVSVPVAINADLRSAVCSAVARARTLRETTARPPVTLNDRLCLRCSLAPVCLPEEARVGADESFRPIRLYPPHQDGVIVHVQGPARAGRSGDQLVVEGDSSKTTLPINEVNTVILHGFAQISTQALRLCADHDIGVHWMTAGGTVTCSLASPASSAQRHLRQFEALRDVAFSLGLARRLVVGKLQGQLRFLLRATRGAPRTDPMEQALRGIRLGLRQATRAESSDILLGAEGAGAAAYFSAWPDLLASTSDDRLRFEGRSRRPPRDRVNALLGYGYGMLYRQVLGAILSVGLHPGMGFYHRPRSAAHTLALDLMELFRVPMVDMPIIAALNRRTFNAESDFVTTPAKVWLSESGRRKAIDLFERRKTDTWRHDVLGYSMAYSRIVELEARLLEKEWCGEGNLFGRLRIR